MAAAPRHAPARAFALALAGTLLLAGCLAPAPGEPLGAAALGNGGLVLPGAGLGVEGYHFTSDAHRSLRALEARFPHLVDLEKVGESVRGQDLLLAKVTNEALRGPGRPVGFIDGCHHGNELQGCEAPLYAAWFLASSHATNATVRWLLDSFEFHFLPVVNPDGHDDLTRTNANGVNLNRNYPTDHGNPLGLSFPWGEPVNGLAGERGAGLPLMTESGGAEPLDQPEARAVADHMNALGEDFAFYVTFHTDTHSIVFPWGAFRPPRPIPAEHEARFQDAIAWINTHTTYKAGKTQWGDDSGNLSYATSGASDDWAYDRHEVFAFTFETFLGGNGALLAEQGQPPDTDMAWWSNSTLVTLLHLLMNTDHLQRWEAPQRAFPYPAAWEGVHWFPEGRPAGLDERPLRAQR